MQEKNSQTGQMGQVKRVHFVGIGGVGMCGIAEVLAGEGYQVSGSDIAGNAITERLQTLGITIVIGHEASHVDGVDVVVQSSAISHDNPEIAAAKANRIPVVARAEMLSELMRFKQGIAISGTHGKTTTTSLVSAMLSDAGLDPSYIIGGQLTSLGSTAKRGASEYFIAEADESDASFLYLKPTIAVVTNIDADHMATYNEDFALLKKTFVDFIHQLPFYGLAIMCLEDPTVRELLSEIRRPVMTYGFDPDADIAGYDWQQQGLTSHFKVKRKGRDDLSISMSLPGKHNALNALAAIAIASQLGVTDNAIQTSLKEFQGVGRRFQLYEQITLGSKQVSLIDDYGHHPKEIEATVSAIREVWPEKRLVHVFQPHRFSRTKALFDDFCQALAHSDQLVLLDIFAAGEGAMDGISSETLAKQITDKHGKTGILVSDMEGFSHTIGEFVKDDDIILMQGAGSIGRLVKTIVGTN